MKKSIVDDLYEACVLNSLDKFDEIENTRAEEVAQTRTIFSTDQKDMTFLKELNLITIQEQLPFLTPFFKGPYFIFTSKIVAHFIEQNIQDFEIPIDWSFSFDSNVGEKIRGFMNNENIDQSNRERVIKLLKFIQKKGPHFDLLPFVIENIRLSRTDPTNMRPFNTIAAFKAISCIDWEKSGDFNQGIYLTKSWSEVNQEALDTFNYYLNNEIVKSIELKFLFVNIFLLKLTKEYLINKKNVSKAFTNLIEFCINELNKTPLFELWLAWEFLNKPNKFRFFGPIAGLSKKLFKDISGMAWDLTHIRTMEQMATTRQFGDFYLPFFVSFDSKFAELLAQTPIMAMIIDDKTEQVASIRENEIDFHYIINEHLDENLRKEFTIDKIHRRRNEKLLSSNEYEKLIKSLQDEVAQLLV